MASEGTVLWSTFAILSLLFILIGISLGENITGIISIMFGVIFAIFSFIIAIMDR